jgi:hypothetical protein
VSVEEQSLHGVELESAILRELQLASDELVTLRGRVQQQTEQLAQWTKDATSLQRELHQVSSDLRDERDQTRLLLAELERMIRMSAGKA